MNRWSLSASLFLHLLILFLFLIQDSPRRAFPPPHPRGAFTSISLQAITPLTTPQYDRLKNPPHRFANAQEQTSPSSWIPHSPSSSGEKRLRDSEQKTITPSIRSQEKTHEKNTDQENHTPQPSSPSSVSLSGNGEEHELLENSLSASFLSELRQHVHQHLHYPSTLRSQGIEGTVTVQFLIDEEGNLLETNITQPSEHLELNQLALRAVERSSPFRIPKKMGRMKIILPIQFKITH